MAKKRSPGYDRDVAVGLIELADDLDDEMSDGEILASLFHGSYTSDDDGAGDGLGRLARIYDAETRKVREAIDDVFVALTGYRFSSFLGALKLINEEGLVSRGENEG